MAGVGDALPTNAQVGSPIPMGAAIGIDPLTQQTQAVARASGAQTVHPQPRMADVTAPRMDVDLMGMTRAMAGQPATTPEKQAIGDEAQRAGFEQAGMDAAGMLVLPAVSGALGKIVSGGLADRAGEMLRTPKGTLKPSVKAIARLGGATLGYKIGGPVGGITGGLMGTSAADAIIPEHPNPPGWSVKLPGRISPRTSGALGSISEGSESVAGTRPRSLVLTPEEAASEERMQGIAKKRASERGLQFAAGMTPREGRSVPRMPSRMSSTEYPGPREVTPLGNIGSPQINFMTDSTGINWAERNGVRVSIPRSVPQAEMEDYATRKLAEQEAMQKSVPRLVQ